MLSQTGLLQRVDAWSRYRSISVKYLSQERNDPLSSTGIKPRVENHAVANLPSSQVSCTSAAVG